MQLPPHEPSVVRRAVNHFLQANSPIRTLDELHVCEVPATPYFPSITEREQSNSSSNDSHLCSVKLEVSLPVNLFANTDDVIDSNDGKSNLEEFGVRRRHRCYAVTARARSFLYHQVRLLVGVLKCAGTGELTTSDVAKILNAKTVTAASPEVQWPLHVVCTLHV
ncbi:hypothetical protein GQ457_10G022710 [Hibiscus cannabinus]